jgi:hypothetical protein
MLNRMKSIWRSQAGVAATEFALMAPILLLLLAGSVEVCFKMWATQKAEKLAVTLADVVAQSQMVTTDDLSSLTDTVDKIMEPFSFSPHGVAIISSVAVKEDETVAKVNWQYMKDESDLTVISKIGVTGANAVLPEDFELAPRDNVIVTEIFYKYEPILPGLLFGENALIPTLLGSESNSGVDVVYRRAFFKPRLGALTSPPT